MKYALLLNNARADSERYAGMTEEEAQAARAAEIPKWESLMAEHGSLIQDGLELDGPSLAKVVRVRDGETIVTDGPYAETKETIGGYFLIEASDLDDAIAFASKVPIVDRGSVEIRPLVDG
jgi:hypothetical protein